MEPEPAKNTYSCEYCDNNISILTKKLQSNPKASSIWWKHGVCSASCSSNVKINRSVSIINRGLSEHITDYAIDPVSVFPVSRENFSPQEIDIMKICRIRKIACQTVLITGNIMQLFGIVGGILLFYSNNPINTLYGLGLTLIGFILIRLSKHFSIKLGKIMAEMLYR